MQYEGKEVLFTYETDPKYHKGQTFNLYGDTYVILAVALPQPHWKRPEPRYKGQFNTKKPIWMSQQQLDEMINHAIQHRLQEAESAELGKTAIVQTFR